MESHDHEEQLPDIMWCRDPFMEQLNEIEAMDGTSVKTNYINMAV